MKVTYCDTPECGRNITDQSRYIVEVSVLNPNETEPKLKPAMPSREICAMCMEGLKDAVNTLAKG